MRGERLEHPSLVRLCHWLTALAIPILAERSSRCTASVPIFAISVSAARTARNALGSCTIAECSPKLLTATVVSSAPSSEMLVAGTTTSSVAPIDVKSKCSGTPRRCTAAMSFECSDNSTTDGLPVGGSELNRSLTVSSASFPTVELRICEPAVASGAPWCGDDSVTTVPIGGKVGSPA